jgi:hypothetical protein
MAPLHKRRKVINAGNLIVVEVATLTVGVFKHQSQLRDHDNYYMNSSNLLSSFNESGKNAKPTIVIATILIC